MRRASFVAAGVAALAAPRFAGGQTTPIVRVGGTPDQDISPALWGVQNGTFTRAGITVQLQRLNNGSAVAAGVIGGSIDIGKSSVFSLILAHTKGVPFILESVTSTYDAANPPNGFLVAKNSPISTAAQLDGKTVAVPALGDLYALAISAWIEQNGGNPSGVQFVELAMPLTAAAIAGGRVAGALVPNPYAMQAVERGDVRIIGYPYSAIAPHFGVTFYFCSQSYATGHADELQRFRRGIAEATTYALAHKAQMVPIIATYTGMSPDVVARMPYDVAAGIDPAMIQPVIDYAAKYKFIPKAFPAAELIDPSARK